MGRGSKAHVTEPTLCTRARESANSMSADDFVDWEPSTSPSTPPPPQTIEWVQHELGIEVMQVEELVGGLSSAVHRLRLANETTVVLRRYTLADWLEREPHIPSDEARNLAMLGELDLGVATPTLVAVDVDATHCDVPAVVMSHVPGRPCIDPVDPVAWASDLAACLAGIHEQAPVEGLPEYRRWDHPDRPLPRWTKDPAMWRQAVDGAQQPLPAHPTRFLHRDYHPNNIHWLDDEICGVVDWLGACNGPVAGDIAHCRWNLAILFEPALADHFLAHYRQITGYSEDTSAFDMSTVLSGPVGDFPTFAWNALGRTDLTSDVVATRIDDWLAKLMTGEIE